MNIIHAHAQNNALLEAITSRGQSLTDFSVATGIGRSTLYRIIYYETDPTLTIIMSISNELQLTKQDIYQMFFLNYECFKTKKILRCKKKLSK